MAHTQLLYHIILRTKNSEQSLSQDKITSLYRFFWNIIEKRDCILYRINGMEEHIHLLVDIHPSISLADFIKEIKVSTSLWMKTNEDFINFHGWSKKYAALTYSFRDKEKIKNYIINQQIHHQTENFHDEITRLFIEENINLDSNWFDK